MKKLTALLLLLPVLASADPGNATKYLINEPASLMDVGLINVERSLEDSASLLAEVYKRETGVTDLEVLPSARYDFADDKINIMITVLATGIENAESGCRKILTIGDSAIVSAVGSGFSDRSYKVSSQPTDLYEKLTERIDVHCAVRNLSDYSIAVTVRSNLASDRISVVSGDE